MRRVPVGLVGCAACAVVFVTSPHAASAAECAGRPTDAGGFRGYAYAAAEVRSHATPRVRVHYATSGPHAPDTATTRADGVPDAVALVADTAEIALGRFSEMGFVAPPSDAACPSNGGDDKLDVYLVAFAGADGTTVPEACSGRVCGSFVLSEATFRGRGYGSADEGFRTVVTHELFHAVQNAYDREMDRFWAEGTAQWAMKVVHPDLRDFERQLPAFFAEPGRSIDTPPSGVTAGYLYGSAVWPLFLATRHTARVVVDILAEEAEGAKALAATEAVLARRGTSLAEEFPLFAAWNAATKELAGSGGYGDAGRYPGVPAKRFADGVTGITSGLSSHVFLDESAARRRVTVETDPARNRGLLVPLAADGRADLGRVVPLPADAEGPALLVVAGITTRKTDAPFTLRLTGPEATAPEGTPDVSEVTRSDPSAGGCVTTTAGPKGVSSLALVACAAFGAHARRARRRRR